MTTGSVWIIVGFLRTMDSVPFVEPHFAYASPDACHARLAEIQKKPEVVRVDCIELTIYK